MCIAFCDTSDFPHPFRAGEMMTGRAAAVVVSVIRRFSSFCCLTLSPGLASHGANGYVTQWFGMPGGFLEIRFPGNFGAIIGESWCSYRMQNNAPCIVPS